MTRDYPPHPLPAALAVVVRAGRILLVRRNAEGAAAKWGFPGGLIETGESPQQAAIRELREETMIVADALDMLDVFDFMRRDADGRIRNHYLMLAVFCRYRSGQAVARDDAIQADWFSAADLADAPLHPDVLRVAQTAFGRSVQP